MFLSFKDYVKREKKNFQEQRYVEDIHYRSVLFRQFGESYRWYCKSHHIADDYDQMAYDVTVFEKRIEIYRNS